MTGLLNWVRSRTERWIRGLIRSEMIRQDTNRTMMRLLTPICPQCGSECVRIRPSPNTTKRRSPQVEEP